MYVDLIEIAKLNFVAGRIDTANLPIKGVWYEILWFNVLLKDIPCRILLNKPLMICNEKCFRFCNLSLSLICVSNSALSPSIVFGLLSQQVCYMGFCY